MWAAAPAARAQVTEAPKASLFPDPSKFAYGLYTEGVAQVRKLVFSDELTTPIVRNQLGDSAGVIGAALVGI